MSTRLRTPLLLLSVALLALSGKVAQAQTSYTFTFDNSFDTTVTPPIIGTGIFNFTNDLGLGTFAYNALGSVDFTFTINGQTFTETDIVSDPSRTTVIFTDYGSGARRLQFSDTGGGAGGPFTGSLDLWNASTQILSFEPSGFGGALARYQSSGGSGSYLAVSAVDPVPEPEEYAVMGMASLCLCGLMLRARRCKMSGGGMGLAA